jgi:hypothetical protein
MTIVTARTAISGYVMGKLSGSNVMQQNMGKIDRIVRILAAVAVAVLFYFNIINGTVALVLGVLAVIFIATSLVSFCPLYLPFGISTRKR